MSRRCALVALLCCFASAVVSAEEYTWRNFATAPGLQLNGNAKLIGNGDGRAPLRLTASKPRMVGSVFTNFGVDNTSFHTAFSFRVLQSYGKNTDCRGKRGGEGLAFVLQGESPEALGEGGGGLGYAGIAEHLAVEFDTFCDLEYDDRSSNHIAVVAAGVQLAAVAVPGRMDDGHVRFVWIDYDGRLLDVRISAAPERPVEPQLSMPIDVPAVVGGTVCCAGFTASTGEMVRGRHLLLRWTYLELGTTATALESGAGTRYASAVIRPVCRNRVGTSSVGDDVAQ